MAFNLTPMAFGDKRIVSFIFTKFLLPGDTLTGTPTLTAVQPVASISFIGMTANTVTCSVTAGAFAGTGRISCEVQTTDGEQATRTAAVPVVELNYNAVP